MEAKEELFYYILIIGCHTLASSDVFIFYCLCLIYSSHYEAVLIVFCIIESSSFAFGLGCVVTRTSRIIRMGGLVSHAV